MKRIILLCFILLLCCSFLYAADPYVTGEYRSTAEGYIVDFVVHNLLEDEHVWDWRVAVEDSSNPVAPEGWSIYHTYREVNWYADTTQYMIAPSQSMGGFSFVAQNPPTTLEWLIHTEWSYTGSVTPTPAPEPSSLLALGSGLVAVGLPWLRRRWR